jgi:hypothetical protein
MTSSFFIFIFFILQINKKINELNLEASNEEFQNDGEVFPQKKIHSDVRNESIVRNDYQSDDDDDDEDISHSLDTKQINNKQDVNKSISPDIKIDDNRPFTFPHKRFV